jgi:Fe-S-cluster containining protein
MSEHEEREVPGFNYRREEPFSYVCNRCKNCCYGKRIPLNPYDLIRLAEVLQISTGDLIKQHTLDGVYLRMRSDEEGEPCVFLGDEGCTVHAGRPGACRVYPLGRSSTLARDELYAVVEPHPQTAGVYGRDGTIGSFVKAQGAEPYFDASYRYLKLFDRLATAGALDSGELEESHPADTHVLDVDATVERYCSDRGMPFPASATEKMLLHIEAIEATLDPGVHA